MKQVWELSVGEGGWIPAGEVYRSEVGAYAIRFNALVADSQEGINQIRIWLASDGYHGSYPQGWEFERSDAILPEDVVLLKSFLPSR